MSFVVIVRNTLRLHLAFRGIYGPVPSTLAAFHTMNGSYHTVVTTLLHHTPTVLPTDPVPSTQYNYCLIQRGMYPLHVVYHVQYSSSTCGNYWILGTGSWKLRWGGVKSPRQSAVTHIHLHPRVLNETYNFFE